MSETNAENAPASAESEQQRLVMLGAGDIFHFKAMSEGGLKVYKAHVLALVDGEMLVFKWYGKHKQRWFYEVESITAVNNKLGFRA